MHFLDPIYALHFGYFCKFIERALIYLIIFIINATIDLM